MVWTIGSIELWSQWSFLWSRTMPARVDIEQCDACFKCADVCPTQCIERATDGEKEHAHVREEECIDCSLCANECQHAAITQD